MKYLKESIILKDIKILSPGISLIYLKNIIDISKLIDNLSK
jgi:hypothetical protein